MKLLKIPKNSFGGVPAKKRTLLGDGWEVECKSESDASAGLFNSPRSGDSVFSFSKAETGSAYRILYRLQDVEAGDEVSIEYCGTASDPTALQWVAVLAEDAQGGRYFVIKEVKPVWRAAGRVLEGDLEGCVPVDTAGPFFVALQFSNRSSSFVLSDLKVRIERSSRVDRGVDEFASRPPSRAFKPPQQSLEAAQDRTRPIVYTCLFGGYENLKEPNQKDPRARYILFTDTDVETEHWEVCRLKDRLATTRRTSRLPKILPHRYLPDHDVSLYIDASLTLKVSDVGGMIEECLLGSDVALFAHHKRKCIYEELEICRQLGIEDPRLVQHYRHLYAKAGVQAGEGLFENTLIVRKNSPDVQRLNEVWWKYYLGERDQLGFMYAVQTVKPKISTITAGRQVRNNPYVDFTKHQREPADRKPPKVYAFIAYAKPSYKQDLGRAYNDYMELIEDDAFALFLDHDAMFCQDEWLSFATRLAAGNSKSECLFIGKTNRIGNPYQQVGGFGGEHRASIHAALSQVLRATYRDSMADVSALNSSSGVVLMMSKATWKKHKFESGFLKVDNKLHISFRERQKPVYMPAALYAYHFYRADGDASHAVRLPQTGAAPTQPPGDAAADLAIHTFIYDDSVGAGPGHYAHLVRLGDWAIFLRSDAMFCDRDWYQRAYAQALGIEGDAIVLFSSAHLDPTAPRGDDIIEHRQHAAQCTSRAVREVSGSVLTSEAMVAFMLPQSLIADVIGSERVSLASWAKALNAHDVRVLLNQSIHVFCQSHAIPSASATNQIASIIRRSRRVAILTLGFWPQQAGMELMIHNLATQLQKSGDLVTLYAPKPSKPFDEITHDYLLMRFRDAEHFYQQFRKQHASLAFDVILVQGGLEAASMALRMKNEFGVAVVLRTHGEDIQTDEATQYGYRLNEEKRAIIDNNIRSVDHNVVIGEHIEPIVKGIAGFTPVTVIHNGVDTNRFAPRKNDELRTSLGLAPHTKILLTVGRNVKKKSFHLAIEALHYVVKSYPDVALIHVGKPGNGVDLIQHAKTLGVSEKFYQYGEANYFDTPKLYACADLFVFPSKVETFGNVTVEALSSGLPCVEFDYEVNRSKITDGVNGFVVPYGDVELLAYRLVQLLEDDALRAEFSFQARLAAIERFDWAIVAEKYRDVFQSYYRHARRPQVSVGLGELLQT